MTSTDHTLTRRNLIGRGGAAGLVAAGAVALPRVATGAVAPASGTPAAPRAVAAATNAAVPASWRARPFDLSDVELAPSIFTANRDRLLTYAREYPADRILANFRRTAGLDTRGAEPPGGWDDEKGLLRGHYSGHFLSLVAQAWAGTGEQTLKDKLDYLVSGLAACQDAMAASGAYSHPGYLAAYPEDQFVQLESYAPYPTIWAPYYTCHKILAGLLDCHRWAGSTQALEVAAGIGRWAHSRLSRLSEQQRQKMWSLYIAGEYGGMNESLAELADLTGEEDLHTAATYFDNTRLLDACATDEDILDGLHANQHIPQFLGYLRLYDRTGEGRYLDAVQNFWSMVVDHRTYAHGGTGQGEIFRARDAIAGSIKEETNAESCACYNMLKLTRQMFFHQPDARLMDYYERGLFNQILGSRRAVPGTATSPEVTYMVPVGPGAERSYGNIGTCCGGTGLENHTKYQDSIYFAAADDSALYVNLFIASTLHWRSRGVTVRQQTAFPARGVTRLTIGGRGRFALMVRVPRWARGNVTVKVNGIPRATQARPGEYLRLTRSWQDGDRVDLTMDLPLHVEQANDDRDVQAVLHGPVVLTARDTSTDFRPLSLYENLRLDTQPGRQDLRPTGRANTFTDGAVTWAPLYDGTDAAYHVYGRRDEPTVAFAGQDTRVPNTRTPQGGTFLDEVWEAGPFTSARAFANQVRRTTRRFEAAGLMSRSDRRLVNLAASRARFRS